MLKKIIIASLLLWSCTAGATEVYVGAFNVYDGQFWADNPAVYSAREAAALIYGGVYTDYSISISASLDPTSITHTANYAAWGYDTALVLNQDAKKDLGGGGYDSYLGDDKYGSAYSAYVSDGVYAVNYVWRNVSAVPEASNWLMMGAGLVLLAGVARRRRAPL